MSFCHIKADTSLTFGFKGLLASSHNAYPPFAKNGHELSSVFLFKPTWISTRLNLSLASWVSSEASSLMQVVIILSGWKNTALGFVRQEVLKKKWLQIPATREILKSQTLRASYNRTAAILQKVGHTQFSKDSHIKTGSQVPGVRPLAPLASRAF